MQPLFISKLILVTVLTGLLGSAGAPQEQPNIILIIADDIATYDLGAYGNPNVQSPAIDNLAKNGIVFENAYVTISSCSPSRSSIITGKYPHNTDVEQLHWPLPATQTTFVELLGEAGYWTGAAGKWHLGDEIKDRFDTVIEADTSGYKIPTGGATGFVETMPEEARSGCDQWIPLLKSRPEDKPFFLWLGSLDAHRPYSENIIPDPHRPEDVFVPPFMLDIPEVRKELSLYYDEITRFDHYIGLVFKELKNQGVAENTLLMIISDNGQAFPRAKVTLYDSGIKTPWIIHWPKNIEAGLRSQSVVSAVDIAPSFLKLAGIPVPEFMEGKSFLPILSNPETEIREYAFAQKNWHDYDDHVRAVTSGKFKYIRNFMPHLPGTPSADGVRSPAYKKAFELFEEGKLTPAQANIFIHPRPVEELYDCEKDPFETVNLAGDARYAKTLEKMRSVLRKWQETTGDKMAKIRTPDEFDRNTGLATEARVRPRPSKARMIELGIAE